MKSDDNSTVVVLNGYNYPNGVLVTNGSKSLLALQVMIL